MPLRFSLTRFLYYALTILVLGAAMHICIILFLPYLSYGNAWNRLEPISPLNTLTILPAADSDHAPLPFMAPDVQYAACRYDLTDGPLEVHSPLPDDLWSVAVYTQDGENYYLISGRDVQSRAVNLLLVKSSTINEENRDEAFISPTDEEQQRDVTVSAQTDTGIVVVRAPVPYPAYEPEVTELLRGAYCRTVPFVQETTGSTSR